MEKTKRIIGLDLLRIFSMFGIVGLHVLYQGGALVYLDAHNPSYYVLVILATIFYTSVDVFGILSGFLNINKEKNKHQRIIELLSILLFFNLVFPAIFYIFNIGNVHSRSTMDAIGFFFPIIKGSPWYIISYTFLFFLIPYINKFCKMLSKQQYKRILAIIFTALVIIPFCLLGSDILKIEAGYSPFWLIYLYMVGAYIKLHGIKERTLKQYIIRALLTVFIISLINIGCKVIARKVFHINMINDIVFGYTSPFIVYLSVLLFMMFKKINFNAGKFMKIISYFSVASFSVYIIHGQNVIFHTIWKDAFAWISGLNFLVVPFVMIGLIAAVYIACCIIDIARKIIFKYLGINKLIEKIGNKLDKALND